MNEYELVVLLHPDLEIDIDTPIAKVEKLISTHGGTIVKRDNWGKKRLAYKIKKQAFAVYVYFEFKMDAVKVRDLDNGVRITEEVIRHLIVKHVESKSPAVETEEETETAEKAKPARAAATTSEGK